VEIKFHKTFKTLNGRKPESTIKIEISSIVRFMLSNKLEQLLFITENSFLHLNLQQEQD